VTNRRPDSRAGFTLVEVAMVLAIVSILARIALPNFQEAILRARATAAVGDVEVVRTAAAAFYARSNQWPDEAPAGVVPEGLAADLPDGFTFDRGDYQLDWERWTLPEVQGSAGSNTLLGVSIATDDELLGNAVAALMGPQGWYTLGNNATFLVSGM
jgi:prepilin-type N-terminal cleavage/methylation domain-containing protein